MVHRNGPMPIGIEDFKKLREGYYFIDKTRFIREILDAHGEVTLITRPRRFGKTLTLSMLKYFFTLDRAEENRRLFEGLDIERAGETYMREQGTRPVVFLTLKNINQRNWKSTLEKMAISMSELYGRYHFLLESSALSDVEKNFFHRIWEKQGNQMELENSMMRLSHMLTLHYGRKPVLLLDEYDTPVQAAWKHGYYDECIGFIRNFFGAALKTNDSLDFAVLTGIARISKESIFSGLNNLKVCSVISKQYSDIFGFTQEETVRLMEDCNVEGYLPALREWYNGYLFGSTEIYNPWSVIQYVDHECQFGAYWINVSGNDILQVLLQHVDEERRMELEGLLQGVAVKTIINEGIIYFDIYEDRMALFMMLLTTGYLKIETSWQDCRGIWWCKLQIPNREIRLAYENEILRKITVGGRQDLLYDMLDAMMEGDAARFRIRLQSLLLNHVSMYDMAYPESFYHGMMLGMSVLMDGNYQIKSNRESGYGRFDLAFFPVERNLAGVVLEFKTAKSERNLEVRAKEALTQIEQMGYAEEFQHRGVKEIWKYGIAFFKKRVWIEPS